MALGITTVVQKRSDTSQALATGRDLIDLTIGNKISVSLKPQFDSEASPVLVSRSCHRKRSPARFVLRRVMTIMRTSTYQVHASGWRSNNVMVSHPPPSRLYKRTRIPDVH